MVVVEDDNISVSPTDGPDEADQTLDLPAHKLGGVMRKKPVRPGFPPKVLDKKYAFVRELGRGSMGQVYVYYEAGIERDVAIKFQTQSDRELVSRFHTEARIAASLQHPNVVTVLADGEYEGTPYIVFEYLDGKSLDKLRSAMPWTEVRKLGLQLASGLAAVHEKGLLHRDIKPANAMLLERDHGQIVKLIDFGVAKSTAAANLSGGSTGTPRYMAPEVWDESTPTEKSDVYSLGLTLYQLCTGVKPPVPPYDDDIRLESQEVDSAFASVINRCLERDPNKRFASGAELYNALLPLYSVKELLDIDVQQWIRNDRADGYLWARSKLARVANLETENLPRSHREFLRISQARLASETRRKRRYIWLAVLVVIAAGAGVKYWLDVSLDRKVDRHVRDARVHLEKARQLHDEFDRKRQEALEVFRERDRAKQATRMWREAVALELKIAKPYRTASQQLEVAWALDPSRRDVRRLLADVLESRARLADESNQLRERDEYLYRLSVYDSDAYDAWTNPVDIKVETTPVTSQVSILRHTFEGVDEVETQTLEQRLPAPFEYKLEPGSYTFVFHRLESYPEIRYPLLVRHESEPMTISLDRSPTANIPKDYIYVPAGSYYFGYGARREDEEQRQWYVAQPTHQRQLPAFIIARYETTMADWLDFLTTACTQPGCADRPEMIPKAAYDTLRMEVSWEPELATWRYSFNNGKDQDDTALLGESLVYSSRSGAFAKQDWRRFPVGGIEPARLVEYTEWLDSSGRLPGARLCTEYEWERAARGADTRLFPHGDSLTAEQANIDATHPGKPTGAGPDAVGTHPESVSPFGVHDMAGNVWEVTSTPYEVSAGTIARRTMRGGSYYQGYASARSVNRAPQGLQAQLLVGLRVCADVPAVDSPK